LRLRLTGLPPFRQDSLGLLERQRAKHWLKKTYETLRTLPL
jgi:hypothetical protein